MSDLTRLADEARRKGTQKFSGQSQNSDIVGDTFLVSFNPDGSFNVLVGSFFRGQFSINHTFDNIDYIDNRGPRLSNILSESYLAGGEHFYIPPEVPKPFTMFYFVDEATARYRVVEKTALGIKSAVLIIEKH